MAAREENAGVGDRGRREWQEDEGQQRAQDEWGGTPGYILSLEEAPWLDVRDDRARPAPIGLFPGSGSHAVQSTLSP